MFVGTVELVVGAAEPFAKRGFPQPEPPPRIPPKEAGPFGPSLRKDAEVESRRCEGGRIRLVDSRCRQNAQTDGLRCKEDTVSL